MDVNASFCKLHNCTGPDEIERGWCSLWSLRDPAGASHAAGPPEGYFACPLYNE